MENYSALGSMQTAAQQRDEAIARETLAELWQQKVTSR